MQSEKKIIPKVSSPCEQTRDIDGIRWTVRRLIAEDAPDVLSRLFADVGEMAAEVLSCPDKPLPPEIEAGIIALIGKEVPIRTLKSILFSSVLGRVKDLDLKWYTQRLLPGYVAANGVEIETMEELNETGIAGTGLVTLLMVALTVNFRPTLAGLVTAHGNDEPARVQEPKIRGKSNLRGGKGRAGQAVPTPPATG